MLHDMLRDYTTQQKTHNLFWPDENSIEQCCAAHIVQGCQQHWTSWWAWISLQSGVTMLNNIVDNLEQCGQQNIVQCCFHQARTGCSFFCCVVYWEHLLMIFNCNYCNLPVDGRVKYSCTLDRMNIVNMVIMAARDKVQIASNGMDFSLFFLWLYIYYKV